jgi:hypothetical protein
MRVTAAALYAVDKPYAIEIVDQKTGRPGRPPRTTWTNGEP